MIVNHRKKECLLQWAGLLLQKDVHIHDFQSGSLFLTLLNRTHERTSGNQSATNIEKFCRISEELSGFYQVEVDSLINFVPILDDLDGADFNLYALLLLVLTYGLQSKNSADFKQCACQLTPDLQQEIMHVTEELLQADPLEGRPVNAEMLACLSRERGEEKICDMPIQHRQLNFESQDGLTPKLYTNSPATPLRDWLDSPQMVQKGKLRVKEQELKQLRREVMEERHQRHDLEFEVEKLKSRNEALMNDYKNLESKLAAQIQFVNEQKDQLDEFRSKEKIWEQREMDWKSMQERLDLYKNRAKEARWWEKECGEIIHERDSLRLKALALEERKNYLKDRQLVESQMSDLISSLRDADKKIRSLMDERNKTVAISEALRRRNDDLERRISCINFDDSFSVNVHATEELAAESGDFNSGESMRVVSDLRIAELESQLAAMSEKMVSREELLKAQAALNEIEEHRVPKEFLEKAKEAVSKLEKEKTELVSELESLQKRFDVITKQNDHAVNEITISKEECFKLEIEAKNLNIKIESYETTIQKLDADLELTKNEMERSTTAAMDLQAQLNRKLILLNESEKFRDELQGEIEALNSKTRELMKKEEELASVCDSQMASIEEKQSEIETLSARIRKIDAERQQGIMEIERLSKKLAETCSLLHEVQLELTSRRSSWQERENALENEIRCMKTELDAVSLQLHSLVAQKESVCQLASEHFLHHQSELEDLKKQHKFLTSGRLSAESFCDITVDGKPKKLNLQSLLEDLKTVLASSVEMLKSAIMTIRSYQAEKERFEKLHEESVSGLYAKNVKLQENVSALVEERDRFQVETEELRSQLSSHVLTKESLNSLKKENEILSSKLRTANEKYARCKCEEERLLQNLSVLKTDLLELETEYNELSNEVDQVRSEARRLQIDHDKKEKQSELRLTQALKELGRVSSERDKLSTQISSLEGEISALEKDRLEIVREQAQLRLALDKTNAEITKFETCVSECDSLIESLKTKIEELENDHAAVVNDLAEKEKKISDAVSLSVEKDQRIEEVSSQVLIKSFEIENLREKLSSKNEQLEIVQLELAELREQKNRVTTEFVEISSELQSLQTLVVEYRSVIDNKDELLTSFHFKLNNKDKCLKELHSEFERVKEKYCVERMNFERLQSEHVALLEERYNLQNRLESVISERKLLDANLKETEENNEMKVSELRVEIEKLLEKQEGVSLELQACEARVDEEVQAMIKASEKFNQFEAEFCHLSLLFQKCQADHEKTLNALQIAHEKCDDLNKQLDSISCANAASNVENTELKKELETIRASSHRWESERDEAIKNLNDAKQHLVMVSNEISARTEEKEIASREMNLMRSDLHRLIAENANNVLELSALRKENERLLNLQDDISRLESEVEILGNELQSTERQRLEWAASEEEWCKKMMLLEQENIDLNRINEALQKDLIESQHSLHDANLRLDQELIAAANELEIRERAFAEERRKWRRTAEEARGMEEAYREMLNSQIDEECEEETRKKADFSDLAALTIELEGVRQNHQHLIEVQEEETKKARREIEAFREEARQAEESLLSLQTDAKRHEKTISSLKEDRSKLRADLQNMKKEYTNVLAESAALHRELELREKAFNELTVQKEELEHTQQMNLTTINNLSDRCETIQQELSVIKTERDTYESKMREIEDGLSVEQVKTDAISHQLENSRDEVNQILGRLSDAIREKEEAMNIRDLLERRIEEIISECNDWKIVSDRQKAENNRLRDKLRSLEDAELNLRTKCNALECSQQEATNNARELSERYECLRSRLAELEDDRKEEVRTYRARLEMSEERGQALENEIADMESQWRTSCQKLRSSLQEEEERLKVAVESRRVAEELLSEERQSRERYRVHCTELQTELLRLEKLNVDSQTRNRQLANKVRRLEVQLEFVASDAAGTSVVISRSRFQSPPSAGAQPSPVLGNHHGELSRSYSEGGNITSLFENVNRATPLFNASTSDLIQSPDIDNHHALRRRHSSPLTPSSQAFKSNQLSRCKNDRNEMLDNDSSVRSSAPATALSALFSCEDEPMDGMEWKRIQELQRRNMQQRSHLQSSYPVETQMCRPEDITHALGSESTTSLSHNYPNDSHRIPFSDLSNPYRSNRLAANTISEDLLRQGSESEKRQSSRIDRHVSGVSVSKMDPAKESKMESSTFKIPTAPSGSLSKHEINTLNSNEPSDENRPPTSSDRQTMSFEVINTPKKSQSRGHFLSQKRQKYNVQSATASVSGKVHRQQKLSGLNRDIVGIPIKRFSSTEDSHPTVKRHSNKEKLKFSNNEPTTNYGTCPEFPVERHVLGRRTSRDRIYSSSPNPRPQPGIIDKRDDVIKRDSQNAGKKLVALAGSARHLTSKRKNRLGDACSHHNS